MLHPDDLGENPLPPKKCTLPKKQQTTMLCSECKPVRLLLHFKSPKSRGLRGWNIDGQSSPMNPCYFAIDSDSGKCEIPVINNGTLENGLEFGHFLNHGSRLSYMCSSGFTNETAENPECSNGTWSRNPVCAPGEIPAHQRCRNIDGLISHYIGNHRYQHCRRLHRIIIGAIVVILPIVGVFVVVVVIIIIVL